MNWVRGELLYLNAWTWIACGLLLKHAGLTSKAIACFDKGVHCATQASITYGAKP